MLLSRTASVIIRQHRSLGISDEQNLLALYLSRSMGAGRARGRLKAERWEGSLNAVSPPRPALPQDLSVYRRDTDRPRLFGSQLTSVQDRS